MENINYILVNKYECFHIYHFNGVETFTVLVDPPPVVWSPTAVLKLS
jgi:hypothetical protein